MTYTTIPELRKGIINAHKQAGSWNVVGKWFGISGGMAFRIAQENYEPKNPRIRHCLGLPVFIATEACPECGQVHKIDGVCIARSVVTITVVEMDAAEFAKIDKPVTITVRRRTRKDQRPRATINTASAESAAKTIRRKMDAGTLAALVELLQEAK